MDWNEVFYIADHRDMFAGSSASDINEDRAYCVMIRPNSYFNYAKHYQLNTVTSYDACLALITKYVSEYGYAERFMDVCMGMSDGFRVESKPELERRSEYYENYQEEISMCDSDIFDAVTEGKRTRVIDGENVSVVVTDVNKPEGKRTIVKFEGPFVEWVRDVLLTTILNFKGHTKLELFHLLENEMDVDCFNEMLRELMRHGVKSITRLKRLDMADLALYLCDIINTWDCSDIA